MLHRMRSLLLAAALLALAAPALMAQPPGPPPADRDSLESRVRQRMEQVLQRQLGLNDDQMRRLGATNRRFANQRRDLLIRERQVRLGLRDEIELGDSTRNPQVAKLLDEMLLLQRRRLDLLETEQKELATFMTPHQRARYFGMEEQIRRRVEEMREQGGRQPAGAGQRRPGTMGGGRGGAPPRPGTRPPV
jgi:periplasmic protein CpxP/Spy